MARIDRWLAGGLRTVMLSSGEVFALKLPDIEDMLSKGMIPTDLRAIAMKFGASSLAPETMDTEALATLLRFMRSLVSYSLRYVWNGPVEPIDAWAKFDPSLVTHDPDAEGWQPVTVTLGDLEEGSIDGDDYAALQGIVSRKFSTASITALSLHERSLITDAEAERRKAAAKTESTEGWESFRGGERSSGAGSTGGQVEDRPGEPDRSSKRAKARSGNRVPAK